LSVAPAYVVSSGGVIGGELEVNRKDVAMTGFKALFQHLLARTE